MELPERTTTQGTDVGSYVWRSRRSDKNPALWGKLCRDGSRCLREKEQACRYDNKDESAGLPCRVLMPQVFQTAAVRERRVGERLGRRRRPTSWRGLRLRTLPGPPTRLAAGWGSRRLSPWNGCDQDRWRLECLGLESGQLEGGGVPIT